MEENILFPLNETLTNFIIFIHQPSPNPYDKRCHHQADEGRKLKDVTMK